ncbi:hypothetical protein EJ04DRAFT_563918 [Polyplosphaeria fusca]|uniref:Uncharacterized protein n=1 Tax=Polyplosphaeria fusca TaxID=682080 RepID=A0A9P4V3X4_9PLEO|nr:hypothetical protein EJ04DRAFT_563918 [Polyplosphaeria fusca]
MARPLQEPLQRAMQVPVQTPFPQPQQQPAAALSPQIVNWEADSLVDYNEEYTTISRSDSEEVEETISETTLGPIRADIVAMVDEIPAWLVKEEKQELDMSEAQLDEVEGESEDDSSVQSVPRAYIPRSVPRAFQYPQTLHQPFVWDTHPWARRKPPARYAAYVPPPKKDRRPKLRKADKKPPLHPIFEAPKRDAREHREVRRRTSSARPSLGERLGRGRQPVDQLPKQEAKHEPEMNENDDREAKERIDGQGLGGGNEEQIPKQAQDVGEVLPQLEQITSARPQEIEQTGAEAPPEPQPPEVARIEEREPYSDTVSRAIQMPVVDSRWPDSTIVSSLAMSDVMGSVKRGKAPSSSEGDGRASPPW